MKSHYYLAIGIRLFAIALTINTLNGSSALIELSITGYINGLSVPLIPIVSGTIIPLLIVIVLWFFPVIIAKSIIKPEANEAPKKLEGFNLLHLLVSMLGIYFVFYATIDLVYYFKYWHVVGSLENYNSMSELLSPEVQANMWATSLEFIVSILCILKSKTIVSKIIKVAS
ncbi:hypothetical protein ACVBE9_12090 [Eionea flava]